MKYTYSVPMVDGELIVRIRKRKKENILSYSIFPDKHVFTTDYEHRELKEFLIRKEEDENGN